jgi:xylulose-5-phosphate/fructose-6-phosphate phosphoketolase
VFAFHGYPSLVHRLAYRRHNRQFHVHGYREEGTITTAFDMRVQNQLDRFHLVMKVVDCLPGLGAAGARLHEFARERLVAHKAWIDGHGTDLPEIREWAWTGRVASVAPLGGDASQQLLP